MEHYLVYRLVVTTVDEKKEDSKREEVSSYRCREMNVLSVIDDTFPIDHLLMSLLNAFAETNTK